MSMTEVSKLAGVSIATVSRVINKHPWVSSETVALVEAAIRQAGYTPPDPADRVRRGGRSPGNRTGCMALVFPDTAAAAMRTPLSGRITHGISATLAKRNIQLTVTGLVEPDRLPNTVDARRVDGLFIRGTVPVENLLRQADDLPTVCLFEAPHIPSRGDQVMEDNSAVGELAANYFLKRGHRHLAVMNFVAIHPSYRPRARTFIETVQENGAHVDELTVDVPPEKVRSACEELTAQLIGLSNRPTAVFVAGTDQHGGLVVQALRDSGVRVPEDMDFICCRYDLSSLSLLDPAVATIDIQAEHIGSAAAETLLWRIANPAAPRRRIMIAPALIPPDAGLA